MKKFFLIVALLLSVNNLTQAYMLEPTKDSVVTVDSAEAGILFFKNSEIMRIIKDSESLNPQIETLNIISTRDTVALKISDSLIYYFSPLRGESCWKLLQAGIKKDDLAIVTTGDSTLVKEESLVMIDSNLSKNKPVIYTDSNLFKKESTVNSKKKKNISPPVEKEVKESIVNYPENAENNSFGIDSIDSLQNYNYSYVGGKGSQSQYPNDLNPKKFTTREVLIGLILLSIFLFALIKAYREHKKNRSPRYKP